MRKMEKERPRRHEGISIPDYSVNFRNVQISIQFNKTVDCKKQSTNFCVLNVCIVSVNILARILCSSLFSNISCHAFKFFQFPSVINYNRKITLEKKETGNDYIGK